MVQQIWSTKENAFEDRWLTVTNVPRRINAQEFVIPFPPGKAQKQFGSSDITSQRTPPADPMNPVHG